mgnify:CR=1 FL=1
MGSIFLGPRGISFMPCIQTDRKSLKGGLCDHILHDPSGISICPDTSPVSVVSDSIGNRDEELNGKVLFSLLICSCVHYNRWVFVVCSLSQYERNTPCFNWEIRQ